MTRQYTMLAGAGALALGIAAILVSAGRGDDEKIVVPKDIASAVNKMADEVGKGTDVSKEAAAFKAKHADDLKPTMWIFKPRMGGGEGGFGVGAKPGPYKLGDAELPDGIEGIILTLGNPRRAPLKPDDLKKAAPDFKRLADVTLAMAELAHQYKPDKKEGDKDPKKWTEFTDEMKQGAKDLKAAVDMNKSDATKAAFTKLYSSCTRCHAVFRD